MKRSTYGFRTTEKLEALQKKHSGAKKVVLCC